MESLVEVERPALMLKWVGEGMEEELDLLLDTGESDQARSEQLAREPDLDPRTLRRLQSPARESRESALDTQVWGSARDSRLDIILGRLLATGYWLLATDLWLACGLE